MTIKYGKLFSRKATPQSQPIPGSTQVPNSAGGHAWSVDDWTRLDRFLLLGTEGGSYYATEPELARDNAEAVERCIRLDGPRAVERIVAVSDAGRAAKNDPAISCTACNQRKGGKTPDQAGMRLRSTPVRPKRLPETFRVTLTFRRGMPESWKSWLRDYAYWNVELEE